MDIVNTYLEPGSYRRGRDLCGVSPKTAGGAARAGTVGAACPKRAPRLSKIGSQLVPRGRTRQGQRGAPSTAAARGFPLPVSTVIDWGQGARLRSSARSLRGTAISSCT